MGLIQQFKRETYPRVCGATEHGKLKHVCLSGLSPRVRGNLGQGHTTAAGGGPIPACAGQPLRVHWPIRQLRAYPRVCGATQQQLAADAVQKGLSPRVRGNHSCLTQQIVQSGPIPACAGQPYRAGQTSTPDWAYPRVCGATSCT